MLAGRQSKWLTITLVVFGLYTMGRFGFDQIRPPGMIPNDYQVFNIAAHRLDVGLQIYNPEDTSPFKYFPTFMFVYAATLGKLPQIPSWYAYCALAILGYVWGTYWLWMSCLRPMRDRRLIFLLLAFGVFGWHGYIEHFSYGQTDTFVFGLFLAAVAARSEIVAGMLMAALVIVKPPAAFFLGYLLVVRRYRALALACALVPALLVAPAAFCGWARLVDLFEGWQRVMGAQTLELLTGNLNQSVAASAARVFGWLALYKYIAPLMIALGGAAVLAVAALKIVPAEPSRAARGRIAIGFWLAYAALTPLSWRWATFTWLPIGVILADEALPALGRSETGPTAGRSPWVGRALLAAFALNGIVLQTVVAHALGVSEVDDLSRYGLYTVGNLLLLATYLSQPARFTPVENTL